MRLAGTFIVAVFALVTAAAPQSPAESGDPREQLASPDCIARAWGAFNAGQRNQPQYASLILPLLRDCDARIRTIALDALIRLHADVPEAALHEWIESLQIDPIVILYAANPQAHAALFMRLINGPLGEPQRAALNSLLAQSPPPGFAARLLQHWKITSVITVHGDGPYISLSEGSGVATSRLTSQSKEDPALPPIFTYRLERYTSFAQNGVLLLNSPNTIYYVRELLGRSPGAYAPTPEIDGDRSVCLAFMAHLSNPERAALHLPVRSTLKWEGLQEYQTGVQQILNPLRAAIKAMKDKLIAQGLLTPQESELGPQLDIHIYDARSDHSIPLPDIHEIRDKHE